MSENRTARRTAQLLAKVKPTHLPTGTFVQTNSDGTIQVDFGQGPVTCVSAGAFVPLPGDSVRCIKTGNVTLMIGPTVPRGSTGTVTAIGSTTLTVTTSIGSKQMPWMTSYTPTVNDTVLIDWASGGIVLGKTTGVPTGTYAQPIAAPSNFEVDFAARDSGTFYVPSGAYNQTDVWCTSTGNNIGAWFYGSSIADTIPDTATITSVSIYIDEFYNEFPSSRALLGLHSLASKSGAPSVSSTVSIPPGTGWVSLPHSFGDALKTGSKKGIGTGSSGTSGNHKFRSRASDAESGKLRIGWTI